jgi:hypothetical protein
MQDLREFHNNATSNSREIKIAIGAVFLIIVAGLSAYGYRLIVSSAPHQIVSNNHLPSP